MSTVLEEAPAVRPSIRHDDPEFLAFLEERRHGTEPAKSVEGNGQKHAEAGAVKTQKRVCQSISQVINRIYDAVSRKRASLEPLRNSTHMETDRHAELGTVLRMAQAGEKAGTLIAILLKSRYPMTVVLAKSLAAETREQPPEIQGEGPVVDEEMEYYLDTLEALGFE